MSDSGPCRERHRPLPRLLPRKGFGVIAEFACRGFDTWWGPLWLTGGLHRTHPDAVDLTRAEAVARNVNALLPPPKAACEHA